MTGAVCARPRVTLVNYADDRFGHKAAVFKRAQRAMSASALAHGVDVVSSWNWEMLASTELYAKHRDYLDLPYHLNGFVFKPFITLKTLQSMQEGEILIYYDSGDGAHIFDTSVTPLIDMCIRNGGTLIHQWGETNQKWTKHDCFYFMRLDSPEFHSAVAMQATWFVLQKNPFTMKFVEEYLHHTLDHRIASYQNDRVCGLPDLPGFIENRGDQSVLSLLAQKYRLKTFTGAGGQANRVIGNFIRWHTATGRAMLMCRRAERWAGVKVENLRHKISTGQW